MFIFVFKQKTAYEMRISDWSSDGCSSDLAGGADRAVEPAPERGRAWKILGLEPGALPRERPAARLARDIVRAVARNEDVGARIERQIGRASCRDRVCQYV